MNSLSISILVLLVFFLVIPSILINERTHETPVYMLHDYQIYGILKFVFIFLHKYLTMNSMKDKLKKKKQADFDLKWETNSIAHQNVLIDLHLCFSINVHHVYSKLCNIAKSQMALIFNKPRSKHAVGVLWSSMGLEYHKHRVPILLQVQVCFIELQ